ncbi:MAG: hypothetical protein QMD71_03165 [bacterium]|nr:hypothetical protein [bacterium]
MKQKILYTIAVVGILPILALAKEYTAGEIIQNAITAYEKQMKGVNDITIVTDMYTLYQKRAILAGKPIYKTRSETEVMGKKFVTIYDGVYEWWLDSVSGEPKNKKASRNPYQIYEQFATLVNPKYEGMGKIGEYKTYILKIEDMRQLIEMYSKEKGELPDEKISGKLWVDANNWVVRKIECEMKQLDEEGEPQNIKYTVRLEDYRKLDGMLIPYQTVISIGGMGKPEISEEEREEMQKELQEMEKGPQELPEEQREMVEKMLQPQREALKSMVERGEFETVIKTRDAKINTGLSDELFDGSKLKSTDE